MQKNVLYIIPYIKNNFCRVGGAEGESTEMMNFYMRKWRNKWRFCIFWDGWSTHLTVHWRHSWLVPHFCRKDFPAQHTACVPRFNELLGVCIEVKDTSSLHCCACPQQQQDFSFTPAGNVHDIFPKQTYFSQQTGGTRVSSAVKPCSAHPVPAHHGESQKLRSVWNTASCSQPVPRQLLVSPQFKSLNDILFSGLISVWSAVMPHAAV